MKKHHREEALSVARVRVASLETVFWDDHLISNGEIQRRAILVELRIIIIDCDKLKSYKYALIT